MPDSINTRLARAAWTGAAAALATHLMDCIQCRAAASRRRPAERCAIGQDQAVLVHHAKLALDREKQLDAAPNPNQLTFDDCQ